MYPYNDANTDTQGSANAFGKWLRASLIDKNPWPNTPCDPNAHIYVPMNLRDDYLRYYPSTFTSAITGY
jgi:hypothetical protein